MALSIKGQTLLTDREGYLQQVTDWSPEVAECMAQHEEIVLSEAHWSIIHFVREFYLTYHDSPAIRVLVKALKERFGEEIGNSIYLHRLFPQGPAKQAAKLAGIPKPKRCL